MTTQKIIHSSYENIRHPTHTHSLYAAPIQARWALTQSPPLVPPPRPSSPASPFPFCPFCLSVFLSSWQGLFMKEDSPTNVCGWVFHNEIAGAAEVLQKDALCVLYG